MKHMREAVPADAALISHLFAESWKDAYRGIIEQHYLDRLPDEYWVPSVRAWLESGRLSALISYEDDQPVGSVVYGRGRDEEREDWGEIVSLYILPVWFRKGHGTALLQAAMEEMRKEHYRRFYLWAIDGNKAADAFYRRRGFHRTGERVAYRIGGGDVKDVRYVLVDA